MRCYYCGREYDTVAQLRWHNHLVEPDVDPRFAPFYLAHTFRESDATLRAAEYVRTLGSMDVEEMLDIHRLMDTTQCYLQGMLDYFGYPIRFNVHFKVDLFKMTPDDEMEIVQTYFSSSCCIPRTSEDFYEDYVQSM